MRRVPPSALLLLGLLLLPNKAYAQTILISFKNVQLKAGERVAAFDLKISCGYVSAFQAPPGWDVEIDNDPSNNVEIRGSILVGAAALDTGDLNKIITITQDLSIGPKLQVTGNIFVTKDFEHTRTIALAPGNIILKLTP